MTTLRSFGIELECFHANQNRSRSMALVDQAIRDMGYQSVNVGGYIGTNYSAWQIKTDQSLTPAGQAFEVVSRTLPGSEAGIEEARRVANYLSAKGYEINSSCGYHIHLDARDMTSFEAACVAYRYNAHRDAFNAVLPRSRHTSHWSAPLTGGVLSKVENTIRRQATDEVWGHHERYVAVNLEHVHKRAGSRRLEFRQHSGTLNADKIIGWYKFLCEFVAETLRIVRDWKAGETTPAAPVAPTTPTVTVSGRPVPPSQISPIIRRQRADMDSRTAAELLGHRHRVPVIEAGTDYDRFLNRLVANRVITQADAREFGWADTRLRVTAHWLRRNGAELVTTQRNGELAYVMASDAATREDIFRRPAQIRRRIEVGSPVASGTPVVVAPVAAAPVNGDTTRLVSLLGATTALSGMSDEVVAWYNNRRSELASA